MFIAQILVLCWMAVIAFSTVFSDKEPVNKLASLLITLMFALLLYYAGAFAQLVN